MSLEVPPKPEERIAEEVLLKRLSALYSEAFVAGVAAELHVIPGAYHGFGLAQGTPQVAQVAELRQQALRRGLSVPPQ